MGSREQEIPHRKESRRARELRVGLGRKLKGNPLVLLGKLKRPRLWGSLRPVGASLTPVSIVLKAPT